MVAGPPGSARGVRRVAPPRGHHAIPHGGRQARDPARDDPHPRHGPAPEGVLRGRRGPLPPHGVPGKGVSVARPGGDLRRRAPVATRADVARPGRRLARRRRRAADSRPRRGTGHAPRRRGRAPRARGPDGQGRWPDARQGPAHRRPRVGRAARHGAADDRDHDARGHGDGLRARGPRPRRGLVHRRGRIVARRVARSHQRVRRAAMARRVLRREQPDGPVDTGVGPVRRPRVRGQGGRLRHPRAHHRRHGSRGHRGGLHLGRGTRQGRPGTDVDRGGLHAHVRACASRRHALPREGPAAVVDVRAACRGRVCGRGPLCLLGRT